MNAISECDNIAFGETDNCIFGRLTRCFKSNRVAPDNDNEQSSADKVRVTRLALVFGAIPLIITAYLILSGTGANKYNNVMFVFVFGNLCPMIFIGTNDGLRNQAMKVIVKFLCCNNFYVY